jgi:GT2 family glycosyltransferase
MNQPERGKISGKRGRGGKCDVPAKIGIHLHISESLPWRRALASVLAQADGNWRLYLTGAQGKLSDCPDDSRIISIEGCPCEGEAFSKVLDEASEEYLIPLRADCRLDEGAIRAFANAITRHPEVLYADQDEWDCNGRRSNAWFKPAWDPDLFEAQDYVSLACAVPVEYSRTTSASRDLPDGIAVQELLWRLLQGAVPIPARRIYFVAVTTPADAWSLLARGRSELIASLTKSPVKEGAFGTLVVERPIPSPAPRVSIIVPTRDRADLLEICANGVLSGTDYPDIELIIANNGSVEPKTLAYFDACKADPRVKVVHWPHPYNYSAINNFAVGHATGHYICLLNNDTEIIDPSWLRQMMAHAVRPGVGAVGARLLYPDRSIQHAGVVVGLGNAAGHAHRGLADGEAGYFAQAAVTREAMAVTAACLVTAKKHFDAVGGLDEDGLGIAYNDVDLCLKLHAAGLRNIYCAQAVLIHHESKSRGLDFAPEHLARYMRELGVLQQRWETVGCIDPFFHPALDASAEVYRLRLQ